MMLIDDRALTVHLVAGGFSALIWKSHDHLSFSSLRYVYDGLTERFHGQTDGVTYGCLFFSCLDDYITGVVYQTKRRILFNFVSSLSSIKSVGSAEGARR